MLGANRFSRSTSSLKRPASGNSARSVTLQEPLNLSRSSIASGLHLKGGLSGTGDDCLRDIDFNDDDTVTYVSSTTMREIFPELETIPVRDNPGENMQTFYDSPGMFGSHHSPMRGIHDIPMTSIFPDTDSGFSSIKTPRKSMFTDNDIMMSSPRSSILSNPMRRSRSLSKLNGSFTSQDFSPPPVSPFHKPLDRSIRHLKDNLEDSENRRTVLMHKLKEAQDTLELQSNRLGKIENTAKGNTFLVEDLKLKEREYRDKIKDLEKGRDEKEMLKFENIRLREEMQDRIDKLDFQLRSLQAQHQVVENENQKRISLLDQSSSALSMLEDENNQIKKERDVMRTEVAVAKEAMQIARNRFEPLEDENRSLRTQVQQLKQENAELSKKLSELTGQLMELRKLTQSMKDENEKLASSWKTVTDEKQSISRQLDGAQNKLAELKTKASRTSTEKDKLFQEKLDLNNKFQQLLINKEQLERAKCELEEQLYHQEGETERMKKNMKKREDEKNKKEEQIYEINKKNQELAAELSSVKAFYERAVEQIGSLESAKKATTQQQDWIQQENSRLKNEVDRLSKMADSRHRELKKENEQLEGNLHSFKDEVRQLRNDRTALENKIHELETKLRKANEDIKNSTSRGQQELDTWKDTCDRLTASVSRKEAEIQDLQDKCLDNEDLIAKQQEEVRTLKDECDRLSEQHEDIKKLKDENRKMHQEKAENEQMIKLLETQKEVLAQSTEHQMAKLHDAEHLTGKVEQLRNDKEQLRERVLELEKVRDNLVRQKEELLASSELIYKKPKLEELESKIEELREANKQLRDINENINERYEAMEELLQIQSESRGPKQEIFGDGPQCSGFSSETNLHREIGPDNQGLIFTSESSFRSKHPLSVVGLETDGNLRPGQKLDHRKGVGLKHLEEEDQSSSDAPGSTYRKSRSLSPKTKRKLKKGSGYDNSDSKFKTFKSLDPLSKCNKYGSSDKVVNESNLRYSGGGGEKGHRKLDFKDLPAEWSDVSERSLPTTKVEEVDGSDENYHMKQAMGGEGQLVPKVEHERLAEEKEQLVDNLEHLRREYDSLQERHRQYMEDYGPDGEEAQRDKEKVKMLEREKDGLEKQVALINGQLLLVESSKKRLDEVVEDLQVEIVHLRKELEEAEKQPVSGPEMEELQAEVDLLRDELTKTQTDKQKQQYLIRSLKEESLDDVGSELHEMRDELQKLMGVIQSKDQAIETLENQLRHSKETVESREKEMQELQTIMSDIEAKKSMENSQGSMQSFEDDGESRKPKSRIPRRTDDGKSSDDVYRHFIESGFFKKSVREWRESRLSRDSWVNYPELFNLEGDSEDGRSRPRQKSESEMKKRLKPAESFMTMQKSRPIYLTPAKPAPGKNVTEGQYGTKFLSKPQRSLSSSDKGNDRLQSLISKYRSHSEGSERKIKPLSLSSSNKMGLVTRGRSFGPAAPKGADGKVSRSSQFSNADEGIGSSSVTALKRSTSPDNGDDEGPIAQSSPTPEDNLGLLAEGDVAVGLDFDADTEDDLDTQEQRDINSLIQKRATHPKPILSVSPPKITSKVIADLLKTSQHSGSSGSSHDQIQSHSNIF